MARRPVGRIVLKKPKGRRTKYTRNPTRLQQAKTWAIDQRYILNTGKYKLAEKLFSIGWLVLAKKCPYCSCRIRGKLRQRLSISQGQRDRDSQGRCPKRDCHRRIPLCANSSLFRHGHGAADIREQALLVHGFLTGVKRTQMMIQYSVSKKLYDTHLSIFRSHLIQYVKTKQSSMSFHNLPRWADIEADEVTLGKRNGRGDTMEWASYLGVVSILGAITPTSQPYHSTTYWQLLAHPCHVSNLMKITWILM